MTTRSAVPEHFAKGWWPGAGISLVLATIAGAGALALLAPAPLVACKSIISAPFMVHGVVALPAAGADAPLRDFENSGTRIATVTSLRYEQESAPGADPVVADWSVAMRSLDSRSHDAELILELFDATDSPITAGRALGVVGSRGTKGFALRTTLNAADWKTVARVGVRIKIQQN